MVKQIPLKRSFIEQEIEAFADDHNLDFDYGFMHWFYNLLFDLDYEELIPDDENVDGEGERQIDFIKIEIDDVEKSAIVNIVQVKNAAGFSSNIVSLMKTGLDLMIKSKMSQINGLKNKKFAEKIKELRSVGSDYGYGNIHVNCFFVTLGDEEDISDEALENRNIILFEYQGEFFGSFEFNFIGVSELNRFINLRRSQRRYISHDLPISYSENRA